MDIKAIIIIFIMSILIFIAFYIINIYNILYNEKKAIDNKFKAISKLINKEKKLLKNYIDILAKYETFESKAFDKARKLLNTNEFKKINDEIEYLDDLNKIIKTFSSLDSLYNELSKNRKYQNLNKEYNDIIDRLNYSSTFFNDRIKEYNSLIRKFPYNIIGKLFGFKHIKICKMLDL